MVRNDRQTQSAPADARNMLDTVTDGGTDTDTDTAADTGPTYC